MFNVLNKGVRHLVRAATEICTSILHTKYILHFQYVDMCFECLETRRQQQLIGIRELQGP